MADYYLILGIEKTATSIEIKTAFRNIAKIYHPDKNPNNPNATTIFQQAVKAYNTLNNAHLRKRYDDLYFGTRKQTTQQTVQKKPKQKEYTFTEDDLKQREYYKNYYKAKEKKVNNKPPQKAYSDYKYILFATPLAIGLLMLIIAMFTPEPSTTALYPLKTSVTEVMLENETEIQNGDKPYTGYFGYTKSYVTDYRLLINNTSNYDAVVCVFEKKSNNYLQHGFVKTNVGIEFKHLPTSDIYIKCMFGTNWNKNRMLKENTVWGGFDSIAQFQSFEKQPINYVTNESTHLINVIYPLSKNKKFVCDENEFFNK